MQNEELGQYIKNKRDEGISDDRIKSNLIDAGWNEGAFKDFFNDGFTVKGGSEGLFDKYADRPKKIDLRSDWYSIILIIFSFTTILYFLFWIGHATNYAYGSYNHRHTFFGLELNSATARYIFYFYVAFILLMVLEFIQVLIKSRVIIGILSIMAVIFLAYISIIIPKSSCGQFFCRYDFDFLKIIILSPFFAIIYFGIRVKMKSSIIGFFLNFKKAFNYLSILSVVLAVCIIATVYYFKSLF